MTDRQKLEHVRAMGIEPHPFIPIGDGTAQGRVYCRDCDGHRMFVAHQPALRRITVRERRAA